MVACHTGIYAGLMGRTLPEFLRPGKPTSRVPFPSRKKGPEATPMGAGITMVCSLLEYWPHTRLSY